MLFSKKITPYPAYRIKGYKSKKPIRQRDATSGNPVLAATPRPPKLTGTSTLQNIRKVLYKIILSLSSKNGASLTNTPKKVNYISISLLYFVGRPSLYK